jgi:hypothetical protein
MASLGGRVLVGVDSVVPSFSQMQVSITVCEMIRSPLVVRFKGLQRGIFPKIG